MTHRSLFELKQASTPSEFSRVLQQKGDIFWHEPENIWVITSYMLAKEVLTSDAFTSDRSSFFINSMPHIDLASIQDFFAVVSKMMVMSDAPAHTARRRICYDGFSNQTLEAMLPQINKTVDDLISNIISGGTLELVDDIAKHLPSMILADFFQIPIAEREQFYNWSNNMTQFFGSAGNCQQRDAVLANEGAANLKKYFSNLIASRRKQSGNDFLSVLIHHQDAFHLDDDEIISQAIMMLVAGQVTTTDQLCNNVYTLLSAPDALSAVHSQSVNFEYVITELNRLDPAVTFIFRVAKEDMQLQGRFVKAGDPVFVSTHAVNRDPAIFENPDEFRLNRRAGHLSYGFGQHYCIGAKLAQIEMRACFEKLFTRLHGLSLVNHALNRRKHHSLAFSGFETLFLRFDHIGIDNISNDQVKVAS